MAVKDLSSSASVNKMDVLVEALKELAVAEPILSISDKSVDGADGSEDAADIDEGDIDDEDIVGEIVVQLLGGLVDVESQSNLIVKCLPPHATEQTLEELFAPHGVITSCKLIRDRTSGSSLGYGFVKFENAADAGKAVLALNSSAWGKRVIKVVIARPSPQQQAKSNLYVAGLPLDWRKPELEVLFAPFGHIVQSRVLVDKEGQSRGIGFVRFENVADAQQAVKKVNETVPEDANEPLVVKFAGEKNSRIPGERTIKAKGTTKPVNPRPSPTSRGYNGYNGYTGTPEYSYNPAYGNYNGVYYGYPSQGGSPTYVNGPMEFDNGEYYPYPPYANPAHYEGYYPYNPYIPYNPYNGVPPSPQGPQLQGPGYPYGYQGNYPGHPSNYKAYSNGPSQGSMAQGQTQGPPPETQAQAKENGLFVPSNPVQLSSNAPVFRGSSPSNGQPKDVAALTTGLPANQQQDQPNPIPRNQAAVDGASTFPAAFDTFQQGVAPGMFSRPRQNPSKNSRPAACLFVFHLPPDVKNQDLFSLFSACGNVLSVRIITDTNSQQSKGYGFVNMATHAEAQYAIQCLNGNRMGNKYLKVSFKKKKNHADTAH